MITRIVKMTFKKENTDEFIKIFEETKLLIKSFEGCLRLELLKDQSNNFTFFTISHWNSEEDLEQYRNSYLFKSTWSKVKPLFSEKAQAWSLVTIN